MSVGRYQPYRLAKPSRSLGRRLDPTRRAHALICSNEWENSSSALLRRTRRIGGACVAAGSQPHCRHFLRCAHHEVYNNSKNSSIVMRDMSQLYVRICPVNIHVVRPRCSGKAVIHPPDVRDCHKQYRQILLLGKMSARHFKQCSLHFHCGEPYLRVKYPVPSVGI